VAVPPLLDPVLVLRLAPLLVPLELTPCVRLADASLLCTPLVEAPPVVPLEPLPGMPFPEAPLLAPLDSVDGVPPHARVGAAIDRRTA
jgi:hypothetical protein